MAIALKTEPEKRVQSRSTAAPSARVIPGNSPFRLAFDPHSWQFHPDTGEFLPQLRKLPLKPGVNGVTENLAEKPLIARAIEKGWQWLGTSDAKLGEYQGYCVSIRNDKGQRHHFSIWEAPRLVGRRLHWVDGFDEDAADKARAKGEDLSEFAGRYRDFLRFLLTEKVVPGIDDAVREEMIERQRELLTNTIQRLGNNPQNDALRERVESMRIGIEAMEQGVSVAEVVKAKTAKPKRRTGKTAEG